MTLFEHTEKVKGGKPRVTERVRPAPGSPNELQLVAKCLDKDSGWREVPDDEAAEIERADAEAAAADRLAAERGDVRAGTGAATIDLRQGGDG